MNYTEKRQEEYCKKFGLCKEKGTCQCKKELKFIADSITQAIAEERERMRGIIDWELTPHGYESDDKYMEHFACELKEKYKNKILSSLDKP